MGDPTTMQRPAAAGHAQRRRLGKYANSASPRRLTPGERRQRRHRKRRERHQLRYKLRRLTTLKRVRDCGHVSINGEGSGPALRLTASEKGGNVAGLSGLAHCGSVWACPVCAAKIATRRAEELADVMRFALEQGCSASMVTLTMRHHQGQSLADCWDALSKAWRAVTSGKQWTTDAERAGLVGWARAVEVTHGKNGWHVHVHALLIWRQAIGQPQAQVIGQRMWRRWTKALQRNGFDSLEKSGGLDVRMASLNPGTGSGLHDYFTKLAHEIADGQAKLATGAGRTPFQLLADAVNGLADEVDRWHEWEQASKGRRQMEWSRGRRDLRKWAGLGAEQTDEEIAEEELTGDDLVLLAPDSWRQLRQQPDQVCELLEAAERAGFAAATGLLDCWGLSWSPGKAAPKYPPPPPGSARLDADRTEGLRDVGRLLRRAHQVTLWRNGVTFDYLSS